MLLVTDIGGNYNMNAKWKKTVIISDVHCPGQDKKAINKLIDFLKDFKPDELIFNGDFLDIHSLSKYVDGNFGSQIIDLTTEYDYGNELLDKIMNALPRNTAKHYLLGNHELRVQTYINKGDHIKLGQEVRTIDMGLHLHKRRIKYYSNYLNDVVLLNKKVIVFHDAGLGIHYCNNYLRKTNKSIIVGHTHRPQIFQLGDRVGIGAGHLADTNSEFMSYATRLMKESWSQGFVVTYTNEKTGAFLYENVIIDNGNFIASGNIY